MIAAAAVGGLGPGILATVLTLLWCGATLRAGMDAGWSDVAISCVLFAAEGIGLSLCSGYVRRAARKVAASEHWHRKLIETSAEGIWVIDGEGTVIYANPRLAEMLGYTAAEMKGMKTEDFFLPADLSMERVRLRNRISGLKDQFDRRLRRKDNSEMWVLTSSNCFFDQNNQLAGIVSMMTDITERRRAEHSLRRSEERFRGLFDNVLEGVYQSTPDGRILAANPMLLRMLGLNNEAQLNDVNIAKDLYVDPGVRQRLLDRLERDGSFQNVEYQLRRQDGGVLTVRENARAVRDEEGSVIYYEGTLSDVSDRKRMEEQVRGTLRVQ